METDELLISAIKSASLESKIPEELVEKIAVVLAPLIKDLTAASIELLIKLVKGEDDAEVTVKYSEVVENFKLLVKHIVNKG